MVKFGRHLRAFVEENSRGLYVVPYDHIRNSLIENNKEGVKEEKDSYDATTKFVKEWHKCLEEAENSFKNEMIGLWKIVFDGIKDATNAEDSVRGALPDTALRLYLSFANVHAAQELLFLVKQIYNTALLNAEALRKLVKKFDKRHGSTQSSMLLPEVYGANFTVGQSTLQAGISLIRASLGLQSDETDTSDNESVGSAISAFSRDQDDHDNQVLRRKEELEFLKNLVSSIASTEIAHIVAHRGFHSPMDRSDCRPLENSLASYEAAWTSGIHLCECDITLTKDEKLILCHDEDFSRLALDPATSFARRKVGDLTYRELISMPLKNGIRPPLLIDVLRSAFVIGGKSQLIIEIKPGNFTAASALARMFLRHPDLMSRCAVVMSFDAFAMHTLRKDLKTVLPIVEQESEPLPSSSSVSLPTTMSLGQLGYRVDSHAEKLQQMAEEEPENAAERGISLGHNGRVASLDHFGMGIADTLAQTRSDSFSFEPFKKSPAVSPMLASMSVSPSLKSSTSPKPQSFLLPPCANQSSEAKQKKSPLASPNITSVSINQNSTPEPSPPTNLKPNSFLLPPSAQLVKQKTRGVPKLMLLTVSEKPKIECELVANVSNIMQVEQWLGGGNAALDGVYMQFESDMLSRDGAASLRKMSQKGYSVGVWGCHGKDPDCYESFHYLVREGGVSYVNSDLPKGFKKGVMTRRGVTFGY